MNAGSRGNLLIDAVRNPAALDQLQNMDWERLLETAMASAVSARLHAAVIQSADRLNLPDRARLRLEETETLAAYNQTQIRYEVDRLQRSLAPLETPVILLKGAAFLLADLSAAKGRVMSDVDILLPKPLIPAAERILKRAGWQQAPLSDYDERYYREWMHEVPALWHPERKIAVDIHHTIVPVTSRYAPDAEALLEAAVDLDRNGLKVLCPADMVLHTAVHLFNEEMTFGLRDLVALHDLLTQFGAEPEFWDALLARARLHGLERPLYHALRHTKALLGTAVPDAVERAAGKRAPVLPLRWLTNQLMTSALNPPPPGETRPLRDLAMWLLFVRSHWLKMPPLLLMRHLATKAYMRLQSRFGDNASESVAKPG